MNAQSAELNSGGQPTLKRRLGRGLNALLGQGSDDDNEPRTIPMPTSSSGTDVDVQSPVVIPASDEIALELIERNPYQPRRDFDQASIDELAESIRKHGMLQPVLVRPKPNGDAGYQLVAGERRWRAAQQIGLESVPCRVLEFEDRKVSEASLEENMKRQDLNVLEKAQAFRDYLERFGGTIEELGRQLSMNRATVSNMMRLLELPSVVQDMVRADKISGGHARAILPLAEAQQVELARQIEQEQLSVRKVEEIVREMLQAGVIHPEPVGDEGGSEQKSKPVPSNHVLSLQENLRQQFGAKIEIKLKKKESGQIVIHFGNNDDFERIVGQLRKAG
ncbi:MAG: ParB/RepB/Spo0J family partition protein [Planctomyces sp.]|nr:ParB/RepB/Spo0J family partition protein [Planctomyces sp.]